MHDLFKELMFNWQFGKSVSHKGHFRLSINVPGKERANVVFKGSHLVITLKDRHSTIERKFMLPEDFYTKYNIHSTNSYADLRHGVLTVFVEGFQDESIDETVREFSLNFKDIQVDFEKLGSYLVPLEADEHKEKHEMINSVLRHYEKEELTEREVEKFISSVINLRAKFLETEDILAINACDGIIAELTEDIEHVAVQSESTLDSEE